MVCVCVWEGGGGEGWMDWVCEYAWCEEGGWSVVCGVCVCGGRRGVSVNGCDFVCIYYLVILLP